MVRRRDTPSGACLSSKLLSPVASRLRLKVRANEHLRIDHAARTAATIAGKHLRNAPLLAPLADEVDGAFEPARHLVHVEAVAVVALVVADDTVESRRDRRL